MTAVRRRYGNPPDPPAIDALADNDGVVRVSFPRRRKSRSDIVIDVLWDSFMTGLFLLPVVLGVANRELRSEYAKYPMDLIVGAVIWICLYVYVVVLRASHDGPPPRNKWK